MTEICVNYFTEIEEHFRRARGTPLFRLSPLDWALIEQWKNSGIPIEAVLRGIDVVFETRRGRLAAVSQQVNSLAYCAHAIAAEAQAMANATPISRAATQTAFSLEDVRSFVARNAGALRKSGYDDLASALESLNLDALYNDLEQLEQRLTALEEEMITRLRANASDDALFDARRALEQSLKPYRGKMTTDQLAMLEMQFRERRLLEAAGLPRLSLFYL